LEADASAADDEALSSRQVEAGHVVALGQQLDADGVDARARAVEPDGQLEALDADRQEICARAGSLHLDLLQGLALERREGVGHVARAVRQLLPARQLAVRLQRGLLALGAVDAADAAGREAELD